MAGPDHSPPGVTASKFADPKATTYRATPEGDIAMTHFSHAPGPTDNVALFLPKGFDPSKPAIIMPYFHGHGGSINDTFDRQKMAEIAAKSGQNIAFVVPQLGDKSQIRGDFYKPEYVQQFLDESKSRLADLYTHNHPNPDAADGGQVAQQFRDMPVVPLSYSGGFRATMQTLTNPAVKGVVLLDSMYAGNKEFTNFTNRPDHPFIAVQWGPSTKDNSVAFAGTARPGSATVVPSGHDHTTLVQYALGGVLQSVSPAPDGQVAFAPPAAAATTATAKPAAPR